MHACTHELHVRRQVLERLSSSQRLGERLKPSESDPSKNIRRVPLQHTSDTTNDERRTTNDERRTTNDEQPTTNNQQPTTNKEQPTNQQPTTNNQQPTNQQPTTNKEQRHRTTNTERRIHAARTPSQRHAGCVVERRNNVAATSSLSSLFSSLCALWGEVGSFGILRF